MIRLITAMILCAVLSVSCIKDETPQEFELSIGDRLPEFSVVMADGSNVSSGSLQRGVALVMFFHTSCPDCRNTLPSVQKIYRQYNSNIKILLISREQNADEIALYWDEMGYSMPYSPQSTRRVYNLFATSRVPRVYISKDGVIKSIYTDNPIPSFEDLQRDIETLLK